jgi:hypothetical protein
MSYKVIYHVGESIGMKTKGAVGRLSLDEKCLLITGDKGVSIPIESLRSAELFRMHGTGRCLKIGHAGGTLFVTVIRFSFFGFFALVTFFATGTLHEELDEAIRARHPTDDKT